MKLLVVLMIAAFATSAQAHEVCDWVNDEWSCWEEADEVPPEVASVQQDIERLEELQPYFENQHFENANEFITNLQEVSALSQEVRSNLPAVAAFSYEYYCRLFSIHHDLYNSILQNLRH